MSLDFYLSPGEKRLPTVGEFLAYIRSLEGEKVVYNNRVVGKIYVHPVMGKVFVTTRFFDSHVLRKWRSIGISREIVRKLVLEKVSYVVVVFRDRNWIAYVSPEKFMNYGRHYWNKKEGDSQLHLPLSSFQSLPVRS